MEASELIEILVCIDSVSCQYTRRRNEGAGKGGAFRRFNFYQVLVVCPGTAESQPMRAFVAVAAVVVAAGAVVLVAGDVDVDAAGTAPSSRQSHWLQCQC